MMRAKIAVPAEYVLFDAETSSTTLVNVLEGLKALTPFVFPRLAFWVALEREMSDSPTVSLKFRLSLNDKDLLLNPVDVKFLENHSITNLVFNLNGLTLSSHGTIAFRLLNNDGSNIVEYFLLVEPLPVPPTLTISQPDLQKSPLNYLSRNEPVQGIS
jgi:hypothetical protein